MKKLTEKIKKWTKHVRYVFSKLAKIVNGPHFILVDIVAVKFVTKTSFLLRPDSKNAHFAMTKLNLRSFWKTFILEFPILWAINWFLSYKMFIAVFRGINCNQLTLFLGVIVTNLGSIRRTLINNFDEIVSEYCPSDDLPKCNILILFFDTLTLSIILIKVINLKLIWRT